MQQRFMPALLVLATACASADVASTPGVTDSTITVGTWAPLTGPAALWGSVGRGVEGYFRMINEDEGGIHGRRIVVLLRDDGYQPSRTVPAVRQMAERDRVFAFVGSVGTAPGLAVKGYLEERAIPFIAPASGNTSFTQPASPVIFSSFAPYLDEAAALAGYAVDSLGLTRLGVIYQNDDFGKSGAVGVEMALESRGLAPAASVPVEVADADLASHVLRLRDARADGVLLWITPRQAAIVRGTAARMSFAPQWMASTVLGDITLMNEITEGAWSGTVGATTTNIVDLGSPHLAKFLAAMRRYSPDEASPWYYLTGMSFAELAAEGLRRSGRDLTRETFLQALEGLDAWQGTVSPPIRFGPGQHLGTRSVLLYRSRGDGGDRLTDWIEPTLDLEAAIRRLHDGG